MTSRDDLPALLRQWRHDPAPAPDFAAGVWARIHALPAQRAPAGNVLPFPVALPLAAALAILAGVGGGVAVNQAQANDRLAAAYARTIDPLQMTAGHAAAHPATHP